MGEIWSFFKQEVLRCGDKYNPKVKDLSFIKKKWNNPLNEEMCNLIGKKQTVGTT